MLFIISTSLDILDKEGSFFWGEKYFPEIKKFIPANTVDILSITEGIIFFNRANQKEKSAYKIKINKTHITRVYLKIFFSITEELSYKSFQVRNALKQYFQKKSVLDLPFCSAVEGEKFYSLLKNGKLFSDISFYEEKNNWDAIYKMLETFMPVENSILWDNAEALNKFSFATAKLSECTENLKKKFPDKESSKEFLKKKKYFRELTIKLRKRCIELSPDNASYYSNLAYTFYQSVNELNTPNGRRDGNLIKDAEQALHYLEKSLSLDNKRITDKYRKAILLSEILPNHILYKPQKENQNDSTEIKEKYFSAIEMIEKGLDEFIELVEIYESFNSVNNHSDRQDELRHTYKKYYIKSLYHIAQKKLKLAKTDYSLISLLYGQKPTYFETNVANLKIQSLEIANNYIDKCIINDYTKKKEEKFLIDLVECDNYISAVYKAYLKAVIETFLFIYTDKSKHLNTAKDFYHKSLEMNFPKEQTNQNKMFILDKIAVLNLLEGKYDAAIKLLEPLYKKTLDRKAKPLPPFVAYTLTIAYILLGNKQDAQSIIENYINCNNKIFEHKFNKLKDILIMKTENKTIRNNTIIYNKG